MDAGFAKTVVHRIETDFTDPTLSAELASHIHTLPLTLPSAATSAQVELDAKGTELWNLSTRLKRRHDSGDTDTLCVLRVFAFLLLDTGQPTDRAPFQSRVRLLKVALKAARFCLDGKQTELCVKVLGRAAHYEEELAKPDNQLSPEDVAIYARLRAEYFALRMALVGPPLGAAYACADALV